ncbi:MAG: CDP-alcohol phosphatidyltransferase family protein [Candidatus Buchananbacteria bacterium]|nr:CDP-alcohol phosphatidyltransferase family protein [Candidatus Buchananbacteria bacterium]
MKNQIPNILTTTRLILTPPLLILLYFAQTSPKIHLLVIFLVLVVCLTDCLDGWYARKFNCISDFGKTYDPLADKWLTTLYLPLVAMSMIHFIPVALLFLKDITSTHLRSVSSKPIPAKLSGRIKTAVSLPLMCIFIFLMPVENGNFEIFHFLNGFFYWIGGILLSLVCIWSGIDYHYQIVIKKTSK